MISLEQTEIIHNILIDKFGGSKGIRDIGLLKSALRQIKNWIQSNLKK